MKNSTIFSIGFLLIVSVVLSGCDNLKTIESDNLETKTAEIQIQEIEKPVNKITEIEKIQIKNTETDIPMNCVSWFDGCNNCSVSNGVIGACTMRYCSPEQLKSPRCLKME